MRRPFVIDYYRPYFDASAEGCWDWQGTIRPDGYGVAYDPRVQNQRRAHRIVYELLVGPIPAGLDLDHLCRNRACVKPAHLEPVTRRTNLRRGSEATKTHCLRGHPFSETNTHITRKGARLCRTCAALKQRLMRAERKGDHSPKAEADRAAYYSVLRPTGHRRTRSAA